jgi:flagellar hook-associated protein 3 FlgL
MSIRVATDSYTNTMLNDFNMLKQQQVNLENEVTTGLSVQAPSDNPEAMETTLDDLSSQSTQQQYSSNITTAQAQANSVYSVVDSLQSLTSQAQSIATEAGSGTNSQTDLNNYASQVGSLIQQALELVNTQDPATGQYLFGGTDSGQPPYTATTNADGDVTGVTYQGNSSVNQTQVASGVTVATEVPGSNTSGTGAYGLVTDSRTGADLFNHLIQLQQDLSSGNTTAVSTTDATNLQNDEDNMTYQVANNGNVQAQLSTAASLASSQTTSLSTSISNASGADLVTTMTQLNQTQAAYEAALESSATIMQLSLVDFLT